MHRVQSLPRHLITIAVSGCLLGNKVRYDGNDKLNNIIRDDICTRFHCTPLCPEYAIGLGIPRDPIRLIQSDGFIQALTVSEPSMDITALLQQYANFVNSAMPGISGYIFKARSPSCGLTDTPVYDNNHSEIATSRGVYAEQIILNNNALPVIDELKIENPKMRQEFIKKVENYSLGSNQRP